MKTVSFTDDTESEKLAFFFCPLVDSKVCFPPESTIKLLTKRSFQRHVDWFFFSNALWGLCSYPRRIKRVCLRACLENIAGIVYKDSRSRADINRQRPSLCKQCNMLALGTAAHGTHSLSSTVTQRRTEFCRSAGFLSLIGADRGGGIGSAARWIILELLPHKLESIWSWITAETSAWLTKKSLCN